MSDSDNHQPLEDQDAERQYDLWIFNRMCGSGLENIYQGDRQSQPLDYLTDEEVQRIRRDSEARRERHAGGRLRP